MALGFRDVDFLIGVHNTIPLSLFLSTSAEARGSIRLRDERAQPNEMLLSLSTADEGYVYSGIDYKYISIFFKR